MMSAKVPETGLACIMPFGPLGTKKFRDCFHLKEKL